MGSSILYMTLSFLSLGTAALEEDAQILKVIEAYCTSAKTRQTLNSSEILHNPVYEFAFKTAKFVIRSCLHCILILSVLFSLLTLVS